MLADSFMKKNSSSETTSTQTSGHYLDQKLRSLVRQEREILCQILKTILEISHRRSYLELGFPNLFSYLVDGIGYSNGSAQRRIDAARLIGEIPELEIQIELGQVKLTQITLVEKAAREVYKTSNIKVRPQDKRKILQQITNQSFQKSQYKVAEFFELQVVEPSKQQVQADGSVRVELTLSKELYENIQTAQALISHAVPSSDLVRYIEYVTSVLIQQKTKTRKVTQESQKAPVSKILRGDRSQACVDLPKPGDAKLDGSTLEVKSRGEQQIRNAVGPFTPRLRKIALQSQPGCQFVDPLTKRQCRSRWFLQIDHKQSRWAGGQSVLANAQVLCASHNREKYRKEAGIVRRL